MAITTKRNHSYCQCECIFISCTLCRTVENGVETVVVLENGKVKSKTINGEQVAIEGSSKKW